MSSSPGLGARGTTWVLWSAAAAAGVDAGGGLAHQVVGHDVDEVAVVGDGLVELFGEAVEGVDRARGHVVGQALFEGGDGLHAGGAVAVGVGVGDVGAVVGAVGVGAVPATLELQDPLDSAARGAQRVLVGEAAVLK